MTSILVDGEWYDIATEEQRLATEYLHKVWVKAGRPNRLEGESAWKVLDAMMQIFAGIYPQEFNDFRDTIKESQSVERTVHEANKSGGYMVISYPTRLLELIKVYFPNEKLQDRELTLKFIRRYPKMKVTKYNL